MIERAHPCGSLPGEYALIPVLDRSGRDRYEQRTMSSRAKKTGVKRLRRTRKAGSKRKKQMNRNGTTRTEAELFGNTLGAAAASTNSDG